MQNRYLLMLAFVLIANSLHAQLITPTDLLQIYKNCLRNEPKFGLSAYQYIRAVDDRWNLQGKPDEDAQGITVHYSFSMDRKSWYQPEAYHIMIVQQYGPPERRSVVYRFKEHETWELYNHQMSLMEATKLDTRAALGGQQTIYTVNDITFVLIDFPPGVNGIDRTYEVSIVHSVR